MKTVAVIVAFILLAGNVKATNPYIRFIVNKTLHNPFAVNFQHSQTMPRAEEPAPIPRYQIPRGAIFCRMEDKLTKATGLWIKVGVK